MSSLEKFAKFANPDKILMVGEALVGTDSVAQARNFNKAFGAGKRSSYSCLAECKREAVLFCGCPSNSHPQRSVDVHY